MSDAAIRTELDTRIAALESWATLMTRAVPGYAGATFADLFDSAKFNHPRVGPKDATKVGGPNGRPDASFGDSVDAMLGAMWEWMITAGPAGAPTQVVISPPSFGGDLDDYNPTGIDGATIVRLQPVTADRFLTGIVAAPPTAIKKTLVNVSASQSLILPHESASSTAANRFACRRESSVAIPPLGAVDIFYDVTSSRWRVDGDLVYASNVQALKSLTTSDPVKVGDIRKVASGSEYKCRTVGASDSTWVPVTGIYNVLDYGATGAGQAVDDRASFQAAADDLPTDGGIVFCPEPTVSYGMSAPVLLTTRRTQFLGASYHSTSMAPVTGQTVTSMFEIRAANCRVAGFQINMDNGEAGIKVQGGPEAEIYYNLFLGAVDGDGDCIVLDNRDSGGTLVQGAYSHRIIGNFANGSSRRPDRFIYVDASNMNACRVSLNHASCDEFWVMDIASGGGNEITHNTIQSRTGTEMSPAGTAIQHTTSEVFVHSNYIERFDRAFDGGSAGTARMLEHNHFDNCGRYSFVNRQDFTANGQTMFVTHPVMYVNGSGALRTGTLIADGRPGQRLTIRGYTWGVEFDAGASNVDFASPTSDPRLSNVNGELKSLDLEWALSDVGVGTYRWVERGRVTRSA